MKKGLLLVALASVPAVLYADADSVEVVEVTVMLRRDKEVCSDKRWEKVVRPVQELRKKADATVEDALDMVDAVTHTLRSKRDGESGIHGQISAVVSDGACSTRCGGDCPCKETGACLCAVKGAACSDSCGCVGGDPLDQDVIRGCEDGSCTRDDK